MISNPIPWPNGARCAVAITWDMDADSSLHWYQRERADTLVASQSQVRYGPLIAIPRLVEIFRRFDQRHTFFIPGWCLERYGEAVRLLQEGGHEIALHGYLHERPNELSAEDEHHWLERGIAAFERVVGARPRGWRAPSFAFSKHSLGYLLAGGFDYDSSLMGDDIPYLLEGSAGTLVELPTQWTLDDWPHYMHSGDFNYRMPISAPARANEVFRTEFDAAWKYGGLWISVWHPFVTGRLSRLDAMVELMEYMVAKGGVWFARLDQISDHVRALVAAGTWQPRRERLPLYQSPIAELRRTGR
ncbi:MAG: polysaccharide deacetylase [Alphaproteobacteria bacterium]|nr:polysaccharide deacetylase [Alphaproteobacteria bacterium]